MSTPASSNSRPSLAGAARDALRRAGRRRWVIVAAGFLAVGVTARELPHPPLSARLPLSTAVTARDGGLLRLTRAADGQYRLWTPLEQIAPELVEATLLYEDRHFRHHPGVNPAALVRAAVTTYGTGDRRVGGSTLTMQLARRLWSLSSRTPGGKIVQILEAYLNLAPYGGNVEGAGAASLLSFGKRPAALTLGESLTLAVIPQSPSRRANSGSPEAASPLDRARAALLERWRAAHPGGPATELAPVAWPRLRAGEDEAIAALPTLPFLAPHFVEHVLAEPTATTTALTTTLDLPLQRLCERQVRAYVARQRARGIENAAAMLIDRRTMAVRALVGSADFFDDAIAGQVNGALAPRSPGSTLKPLVYALGMDQGIVHPATMLRDVPTAFAAYSPENFDGRFVGPVSAKDALIRSRNVPALSVAARLSRPTLYDLLKTSGAALPFPESHYGLGLALGTGEVTMEDLVRLYAALGNGGVVRPLVWRAADERASAAAPGLRVLSEESAFLVVDMLLDNPAPGARHPTAAAARPVPVAWKTGTSWGFRDAWSVGLFGPYVLAVWVGDFSGAGNPVFVGAEAAAPLFFQLVDAVAARDPNAASFPHAPPPGVKRVSVCGLSGGLPTPHCTHRKSTWFIPGRSPIEPCAIHRSVALDAGGRRTCLGGPPAVRTEVFEVWPSDLAKQFAAAGLPRRALPAAAPGCSDVEGTQGDAPRITSPLAGVTYKLRRTPADSATVALQAVAGGDATALFWFADQTFLGKTSRGGTLFWKPTSGGRFTVRAVDDLGRSDARQMVAELSR
jgi:penicillin-binding protein 1C